MSCEFCDEFAHISGHTFGVHYKFDRVIRVARDSEDFAVFPTIGQIVQGSTLLSPIKHVESFAQAGERIRNAAASLAEELTQRISDGQLTISFEHGSSVAQGAGCGIYHAHLHIMRVPSHVTLQQLVSAPLCAASDLSEAWGALDRSDNYIMFKDTYGNVNYFQIASATESITSQFLRRKLVSFFRLNKPWDWRAYSQPEPDVVDASNMLLNQTLDM